VTLSAAVLLAVWVLPLIASTGDAGVASVLPSDSPSPSGTLQITMEAKTPFMGGLAGRAQCDDEGNIYFRPTDDETAVKYHPISALPIRKVKPDGGLGVSFSISDAAPGLLSVDFFVTGDGMVYQVARSESDRAVYIVSYSPDGSLRSKSRLEAEFFVPYKVAVFRSGELLVSGIHGSYNRTPFTAVYSGAGKLIREIYEPEDEDSRKRAEAGEPGFRPDSMESSNDFVVRGDALLGSDGNVYLLRAASPALIYVISPKGEIVRKLRVASPDSGLSAERLRSAPGMLAISFLRKGRNTGMIEVVDYEGHQVATYAPNDSRMHPGLLGCYSQKGFTFLSLAEGENLRLTTAQPK
jgi:hypothetical protein